MGTAPGRDGLAVLDRAQKASGADLVQAGERPRSAAGRLCDCDKHNGTLPSITNFVTTQDNAPCRHVSKRSMCLH